MGTHNGNVEQDLDLHFQGQLKVKFLTISDFTMEKKQLMFLSVVLRSFFYFLG